MDLQALIDELDQLIRRAVRMPIGGKLLIDEAALRGILKDMQATAPDELRAGQRISAERDRILADARHQARRIIEDTQAQAYGQLDEQGIVQAARQRAREMQQEAERVAARLRADADDYVFNQLSTLETRLVRTLREVQAGQQFLKQQPTEREGPPR